MAQYVENEYLQTWSCGECGIRMAVALSAWEGRQKTGKDFYCFNGHCRVFRDTTEKKLQRDLDRERQVREAAEARAGKAEQNLAQVTKAHRKMRERVMNGVCPCCNRSFANLREHMKSEHADFGTVRTLFALRQAFGMTQAAVAREAGVDTTYVSFYENEKKLPAYAKERIEAWLDQHSGQAA